MVQAMINGEEVELVEGTTVEAYVLGRGFNLERIAVELNGQIVPKARYAQTVIHDRDAMEIVNFVGGG